MSSLSDTPVFTLQSRVIDLVDHPKCQPKDFCRTTIRLRLRWADMVMEDFLKKPAQAAMVDALEHVKLWIWDECDAPLQHAINDYLDKTR